MLDDEGQERDEARGDHHQDPPQAPVGTAGEVGGGDQVDDVEVAVDGATISATVCRGPSTAGDGHEDQDQQAGAHDERHDPVAGQGADHVLLGGRLPRTGDRVLGRRSPGALTGRPASSSAFSSARYRLYWRAPPPLRASGLLVPLAVATCLFVDGRLAAIATFLRRPPVSAQPGWSWPSSAASAALERGAWRRTGARRRLSWMSCHQT